MADLKLDTLIKVLLMTTSETDGEALAAIRRANSMLKNAGTEWRALLEGKVTVVADPFGNIEAPVNNASSRSYTKPSPPKAAPQHSCISCSVWLKSWEVIKHNGSDWCKRCYDEELDKAARPAPKPAQQRPGYTRGGAGGVGGSSTFTGGSGGGGSASYTQQPGAGPSRYNPRNTNTFAGNCFNCNVHVPSGYGALRDVNSALVDGSYAQTKIFCEDCNDGLSRSVFTMRHCIDRHNSRLAATHQAKPKSPTPRASRKVSTKDLMSDIFDDPFDP